MVDNPANFTEYINRRTLTHNDAKGLRNAFTSARIGLSKVVPGIRSTRDKDYPLWPLIKYSRYDERISGNDFESPKLAILREMSDILLSNNQMPNYLSNNDFREYNYNKLILNNTQVPFTNVEKQIIALIAYPELGIMYGNDRLILFYIKSLLKWYDEFKKSNPTVTANDIVKGMKSVPVIDIIENDYDYFGKSTRKVKFQNIRTMFPISSAPPQPQPQMPQMPAPTPIPIGKSVQMEVDVEGTEDCPSAGKEPNSTIPYNKQVLLFHSDRNRGCKNKEEVNRKFQALKDIFGKAGGKATRTVSKGKRTRKAKRTRKTLRKGKKGTKRRY